MYFLTKSWAAVASALMFSASSAIAASGSETKLQTYAISGGQSVAIPVNAQGVLPASADGVQVEFAGPLLGPSEQSQKGVVMAWAFSLSVPSDSKYKSVKVENVSAPIATTLIAETNPKSEQFKTSDGEAFSALQLLSTPTEIANANTAWMFKEGLSTEIFRITLESESGKTTTLFQAAQFAAAQKTQLQLMASSGAQ